MKLLEDEESIDEEVINGLIKNLKIPLPSLQNPPSQKEILFPARLISLLAQQMWQYGYIKESERLFANVMKTMQNHVMVSRLHTCFVDGNKLVAKFAKHYRTSKVRGPFCLGHTGSQMFMNFYHLQALLKVICFEELVLQRIHRAKCLTNMTMSGLCQLSSMTLKVWSTTSTTHG
jgi:hypothetical protein